MTSRQFGGQKRSHSDTHVPNEPQTPTKRIALTGYEPTTPSTSLTPEQRKKRMQGILAGLSSTTTTPTRRGLDSGTRARPSLPAQPASLSKAPVDRGPYYPPSDKTLAGFSEALLNTHSASSSATAKTPQDEIDSEEEFWTSPSRPVMRPPMGEFSAVGYLPSSGVRSGNTRNSMLTPPRSSTPARDTDMGSPSSTFQVSELLGRSPEPEVAPRDATNGYASAIEIDFESSFEVRAPSGTAQPVDPASPASDGLKSATTQTWREYLAALNSLPDQLEKLERKHRTAEQSAQKKQERIDELEAKVRELEAQVLQLDKQCSKQEAVIENFNILIINRGIPAAV